MFVLHATVGAFLILISLVTGSYLTYKLLKSKKTTNNCVPIIILLSETIVAFAIGILNMFCYGCLEETEEITVLNITEVKANRTMCETKIIDCEYKEMVIEQIILVVTAVHCFISLMSSSEICSKQITTKESCTSTNKSSFTIIAAQWLMPFVTALCLYYTIRATDNKKLCEMNTQQKIVNNFQTLVSELLDQPMNITEKTVYETEIDNIIGKVYSIVESATQVYETQKVPDLDEGFQISNILNKLHSTRAPKQLNTELYLQSTSYKIFTLFFILFVFIPMIYTNNIRVKVAMDKRQDLDKYLKILMISAASLWTPCIAELFSRTYITQTHPDITMHVLMTFGSSFMLVKNGLNLRLLNKVIGHENSVQPKV